MEAKYKRKAITAPVISGSVPIEVTGKRPVRFEAWNEDFSTGLKSPKVDILVRPEGTKARKRNPKEYYFHTMAGIEDQAADKVASARHQKEVLLCTADWVHCESDKDIDELLPGLIAAREQVGLPWFAGLKYGGKPGQPTKILKLAAKSPMSKRHNGMLIVGAYMQSPGNLLSMVREIEAAGYVLNVDVCIYSHMFYPYVMSGIDEVNGLNIEDGNPYPDYSGYTAPVSAEMVAWLADNTPVARFMLFPSENSTGAGMIGNNQSMAGAQKLTEVSMAAGDVSEYSSETGIAFVTPPERVAVWENILSLPPEDRTDAVIGNTKNDLAEATDQGALPNQYPYRKGLGSMVKFAAGYVGGNNVRHLQPEHLGAALMIQPYLKAYLADELAPTIDEYKIFYRTYLHPADVKPRKDPPLLLINHDPEYAKNWPNMMYSKEYDEQEKTVKEAIRNYTDDIWMAAWMPKAGYMEINGVRSELKPAGINTFVIKRKPGVFGSDVYAIIVGGKSVLKHVCPLPFAKAGYPSWYRSIFFHSDEKDKGTIQTAPVVKYAKGQLTVTGTGDIWFSKDHDIPERYTGPITVPKGLPEQHYEFWKGETATYNVGPSAFSPAT